MSEHEDIKEGLIDQIEKMFKKAKEQLEKVECPEHGKALKKLEFDRANGRFRFDTCCKEGERLVEKEINNL